MKKNKIIKSALVATAAIIVFTAAFCLGIQWAAVQGTNGQLMMNLQVSNLIRDGNIPSALEASETFTAANVSVLNDLDNSVGLLHIASKLPRILFYRDQFLDDYKTDAAIYFSEHPNASFNPEVTAYLRTAYPQHFTRK